MEKYYLKSKADLKIVKRNFNENPDWLELIDELDFRFPCILIASYSDHIEFGDYYQFEVISLQDFDFLLRSTLKFSLN